MVRFVPKRPGKYKIMLNYGGEPVPGCPLVIQAEEAGAAKADGKGLSHAHVGQAATFIINGPGLPGIPSVTVEGPDSVAKCEVKRILNNQSESTGSSGHFQASYVPTEVGVFDIRVTWAGMDIPGSPFHPRVVDGSKLRVIGGWETHVDENNVLQLVVGEDRKIAFNTTDAGPGILEARLEPTEKFPPGTGSEDDLCRVETATLSRSKVLLSPMKPGEYRLALLWGTYEIEGAPKYTYVHSAPSGEVEGPVLLSGAGTVSARCGEDSHFTIDASQAGIGSPHAVLTCMDIEIPVVVQPIGGGMFKATYFPRFPGNYLLKVSWAGKSVPGCPLPVQIGANGDASKVICSGEGLRVGNVGKDIRSFIDTRRAGPGELTAQCMGMRKTAYCELYDHADGTFTLNIRPQEAGKHSLSIKYSGEHAPGSPFNLKVVGLPDASRVKVYGPGIEHGVLATFQSRFICDTRGAGAGQLTVRIRGPKGKINLVFQFCFSPFPTKILGARFKNGVIGTLHLKSLLLQLSQFDIHAKSSPTLLKMLISVTNFFCPGAFRVEMQRENQKDRTILCKFDPTEPGDYRIEGKTLTFFLIPNLNFSNFSL